MKAENLDTRLEQLVDEATSEAATPEVGVILHRGRRRRRRRVAGAALASAALVAAVLMVPASVLELPGISGSTQDAAPADRPGADRGDADGAGDPGEGAAGEEAAPTGYPGYWYGKIDASVYLGDGTTEQGRADVRDRLESLSGVQEVYHEPPAEAYAHFAGQFGREPEFMEQIDPESMPESFRVLLDQPSSVGTLKEALCPDEPETPLCGGAIETVTDQHELISRPMLGDHWPDRTDVTLFLTRDIDANERESLQARLESGPLTDQVHYESPAEAERNASREVLDAWPADEPLRLPASFRVSLASPATGETAESFLDSFCTSRRTGDCAPGVALVMLHPRG